MRREILHIDMDAFFASVEQRDDPSLQGKPVLVGGRSRRSVVAAASYEARPFGVHSAMPMAEALRKCPQAIVVPPRGKRYQEVSDTVFTIFRRFTPLVEGLSLDEAFLDVTGSRGLFGDGRTIAERIRAAIREETGLTASAGVAPSKFVAKIASDFDKPDGLVVVEPDEVVRFLTPLPLERMWGVGPKAAAKLRQLGYQTFGDLARADPDRLERALGVWGRSVFELSRGRDEREVVPHHLPKSIGHEMTFERDLVDRRDIERTLLGHARGVSRRLREGGYCAGRITVKIKYADFTVKTRQINVSEPIDDATTLFEHARRLLDRFVLVGRPVRLTGLSASDLRVGAPPRLLFEAEVQAKRRAVEEVENALHARFGDKALTRAELLLAPSHLGAMPTRSRRAGSQDDEEG